ncbi:MAG: hypothetical protein JNL54_14305 [Kineosporiaceae bacterium]|nr:hypothetical protein [Kineosporiaceae bacterium]
MSDRTPRRSSAAWLAAAVTIGLLGGGLLVRQGTNAAFTATTSNGASNWAAGSVTIGDDDSGTALFTASGLVPEDTGSKCIRVTYTGTVTSAVKLYVSSSAGSLADYLDVVVEEGSGGGNVGDFSSCSTFSGSTIYSGTLAAMASAKTGFATGVGSFAPTGSGQFKVYKFTYTLNELTPNGQQSETASATFQWESQS